MCKRKDKERIQLIGSDVQAQTQTARQAERHTARQAERHADRQADRPADRQTHTHEK